MSRVKEAGGNQTSSSAAAAAAALENRIARKTAQMEAGQVLIAEASRHAAEAKEELLKERESRKQESKEEYERDRTEEKRDTSELSRQSKWFGIEGKLLKDANVTWTLEMEQELWEAYLRWMPVGDQNLSAQLEELSKLYLALLEAILTHTMGEEQAAQMERLNEILAQKLNLLVDVDLKDLMEFLNQTGQKETLNLVKTSVYKQTTGETISARAADRFYARGKVNSTGGTRYFMPESQGRQAGSSRGRKGMYTASGTAASAGGLSAASEEGGSLYKLTKGGNVKVSQGYDGRKFSGEQQMLQRNQALSAARNGSAGGGAISGGKAVLTGRELERANRFAAHINGSGNLLKNPDISARNEEVAGLLAAVTAIKGQMYASTAGKAQAMSGSVKSAVNQMVDYYLAQKGVYKVYHHTTNIYEKTGSPQKAIEEGLSYAYKTFMEKKGMDAYRQQEAYSDRAGFFQMLSKGQTLQADLIRGMKLLESNWRDFLKAVGEDEKKGIALRMQKHSPWGFLMEPEALKRGDKETDNKKVLITQAVCIAVLVLGYLCYRLFFG
jgi:hypothetical protein